MTIAARPFGESPPQGASTDEPLYSLVIPVYRSAPILPRLMQRLDAFFAAHRLRHEVIFVNDGSPDESWEVLERLKAGRDDVVCIDLMRNYGQHSAVYCGLQHARGDFVITLDDDLQNPPEEMIHLITKAQEGYDVVIGAFQQKMHGPLRRLGSKLIGWLNMKLFHKPPELVLTNYRLLRREVVDGMCALHTAFPYIPGLMLLTAKTFANVPVVHQPRAEGRSNYDARTIARLVWRIVFNYSSFPLRFLCAVGGGVALISFVLGAFYLVRALFIAPRTAGFPTLVVLLSFYQGFMLLIFAAVGEYLVRISSDVSGRRAYRVRRKI